MNQPTAHRSSLLPAGKTAYFYLTTRARASPDWTPMRFFACVARGCGHIPVVDNEPPSNAIVLPTDRPESFRAAARRAAELLRAGEVVALPTETVYGLAANALDARAIERIFEVKGRPAHNPIIVHVTSVGMAKRCVAQWPRLADKLARAFWPGPLTLVLPRAKGIPDIIAAGGPTVGVRWPSHPFIQAVIRECDFPLAAPSANPSNRVSPTTAEHVRRYLGDKIQLIVDGGPAQIGIESTVLDISGAAPRLLRPGMIHEEALVAVTGKWEVRSPMAEGRSPKFAVSGGRPEVLRSPGLLRQHYAPKAKLVVWSWEGERELQVRCGKSEVRRSRIHVIAHTRIPSSTGWGGVWVIPHHAAAFARAIYATLHQCDEAGAELIVVEALPDAPEWRAVADRLRRAAG